MPATRCTAQQAPGIRKTEVWERAREESKAQLLGVALAGNAAMRGRSYLECAAESLGPLSLMVKGVLMAAATRTPDIDAQTHYAKLLIASEQLLSHSVRDLIKINHERRMSCGGWKGDVVR